MKRAEPREYAYEPGYFSEPVRMWDGLNRYVPVLHELLKGFGGIGSAERAQRASENREARLNSDNPDTKWAARGTIEGMAGDLFKDRAPLPAPRSHKPPPDTFEGKPCKLGHTLRYANGGAHCVVCKRADMLARAAALRKKAN